LLLANQKSAIDMPPPRQIKLITRLVRGLGGDFLTDSFTILDRCSTLGGYGLLRLTGSLIH
jgi:hypothetical protein